MPTPLKTQPKCLSEIIDALTQNHVDVSNDPRKMGVVHESSNALGKATKALATHFAVAAQAKVAPDPKFLAYAMH